MWEKIIHKILVPDDTVHKGNSKSHKTDEKGTHFAVHVFHKYLDFLERNTTTTIPLLKIQWASVKRNS